MQHIYKSNLRNAFVLGIICLAQLTVSHDGLAQLNPSGSAYFQNQYMLNPAFSGMEEYLKVNLSYRQQAKDIGSAANIQYLTADYGFNTRMGLGVNIARQEIGLLEATRFMATYAYHLPLAEHQNLSFGLSLGAVNERISEDDLKGDQGDPVVAMFNDTGIQFDSDFGVSYTFKELYIQAAGLHLTSLIYDDEDMITTLRQPTAFAAASYKLPLREGENAMHLTPKAIYRKVKGFKEVIDIGAQISFLDERLDFFTMYHTSKCATFGLGTEIKKLVAFSAMYTTQASEYDGNAGIDFEFALQIKF